MPVITLVISYIVHTIQSTKNDSERPFRPGRTGPAKENAIGLQRGDLQCGKDFGREEAVPAESVSDHHSPEQPALIHVADSRSSRQHHALISNAKKKLLPKATSIKESTKASTEEDTEQHDQDRYGCQSPPLDPKMLLQPVTRPVSHDQLVTEVKGIYAGLVMVEVKCIDIDERQLAAV